VNAAQKQFLGSFFCVNFSHSLEESSIFPVFFSTVLFALLVLGSYFGETDVDRISEKGRNCIGENQKGQASSYFGFDFVVMELIK
jgi:hypothetical protein